MKHLSPSQRQTKERMEVGGGVTQAELHALRLAVGHCDEAELVQLKNAIDTYANTRRKELATDQETNGALLALKQSIDEQETSNLTPLRQKAKEFGQYAGEVAGSTLEHAHALTEREFTHLMSPSTSIGSKILRGIGVFSVLYVGYRLARWAVGKPGDSFLGKLLKCTGLAALAGYGIHYFGEKLKEEKEGEATVTPHSVAASAPEPKPAPAPVPPPIGAVTEASAPIKQAVTAPVAVKKKAPAPMRKKTAEISDAFAQNQNLVGKPATTFMIDGVKHSIEFRSNTIILDRGSIFAVSALGTSIGDVELGITDARFVNGKLSFTAGAWGQKDTATLNEDDLKIMLADLLKGRSVQRETDDGRTIEIAPKKYQ